MFKTTRHYAPHRDTPVGVLMPVTPGTVVSVLGCAVYTDALHGLTQIMSSRIHNFKITLQSGQGHRTYDMKTKNERVWDVTMPVYARSSRPGQVNPCLTFDGQNKQPSDPACSATSKIRTFSAFNVSSGL